MFREPVFLTALPFFLVLFLPRACGKVLNEGVLVQSGTKEEVLANPCDQLHHM